MVAEDREGKEGRIPTSYIETYIETSVWTPVSSEAKLVMVTQVVKGHKRSLTSCSLPPFAVCRAPGGGASTALLVQRNNGFSFCNWCGYNFFCQGQKLAWFIYMYSTLYDFLGDFLSPFLVLVLGTQGMHRVMCVYSLDVTDFHGSGYNCEF